MRETLQRSRSAFGRRRCLIASADRVLITSVVALFDGIGPLVGVTTSEADALSCLEHTPAAVSYTHLTLPTSPHV